MFLELQKVGEIKLRLDGDMMSEVKFDVLNARVTFKNIPLHTLSKFAFKDVNAACEEFKKLLVLMNVLLFKPASRVEIFTVSNVETEDSPDARRAISKVKNFF